MNNYEKITNKTPRELALFLKEVICCKNCPVRIQCTDLCRLELEKWLESESEGE